MLRTRHTVRHEGHSLVTPSSRSLAINTSRCLVSDFVYMRHDTLRRVLWFYIIPTLVLPSPTYVFDPSMYYISLVALVLWTSHYAAIYHIFRE
jgi:hypothetical protein